MARYKDMNDFAKSFPELAELLLSPKAESNAFLASMKVHVEGRKNLTPKMIAAMQKWTRSTPVDIAPGPPAHTKGDTWKDLEVKALRGGTKSDEIEIELLGKKKGRGRVKLSRREAETVMARLEALAEGENLLIVLTGHVVWVSPDGRFPIADCNVMSQCVLSDDGVAVAFSKAKAVAAAYLDDLDLDDLDLDGLAEEPVAPVEADPEGLCPAPLPPVADWKSAFKL